MFISGSGTAYGKLILIGEHSVVYGKPGVVMPLKELETSVNFKTTDGNNQIINSNFFNGNFQTLSENFPGVYQLINSLLKYFNYSGGFTIQTNLNIPTKRGLGSSAAISVAITKAFFNAFNQDLEYTQLLSFAQIEENITHGRSSGIDILGASHDQLMYFKDDFFENIDSITKFYLVVADSQINGETKKAVQIVERHDRRDQLINQLSDLTENFIQELKSGDLAQMGEIFNKAQNVFVQFGISHPTIDHMIRIMNQNGALGAKLSGGGLGGIVFALADDFKTAEKIQRALINEGFDFTFIEKS